MKTILLTQKVKLAIQFLADEGKSDTSDNAWIEALKSGAITKESIYQAMTAYGMKWDTAKGYWYTRAKRMPAICKMFAAVQRIDNRLLKKQGLLEE